MGRRQQILIVIGVLVAIVGFLIYSKTNADWQLCQTTVGQIVRALDTRSADQCVRLRSEYDASIACMAAGAALVLAALFVRPRPS